MRIHASGFARRNAEKVGVELVGLAEEAAPARVHFAWFGRGGIGVVSAEIPAIFWHFGDGVGAILQQLPKGVGAVGAREMTANADDGNWVVGCGCGCNALGRDRLWLRLFPAQVGGQLDDGGVIPHQRWREVSAEPRFQLASQFDSLHRIQSVVDKGLARVDVAGRLAQLAGDFFS